VQPTRGCVQSPPRPSPWGLAWALPAYAILLLFRVSDSRLVEAVVVVGASAGIYVALVRLNERRSVGELRGGMLAVGEAGLGVAMGLAVFAVVVGVTVLTGVLSLMGIVGWRDFSIALAGMATLIAGSVFEELLYRGIVLRYAELWLGSWVALALSSLLFAAGHFLGGPQPPEVFIEHAAVGVLCGAAYLLTRRLWMPFGIHVGLNIGVSLAFGSDALAHVAILTATGDQTWVSVWRTAAALVLAGILVVVARRRGRMVKANQAWRVQCGKGVLIVPTARAARSVLEDQPPR
jgi:membrane protease YdiL (CAAX protease family)